MLFRSEIYLPETKASGELIQSTTIPVTHYELNQISTNILTQQELNVYNSIKTITNGLVYEHFIHDQFDKKIINETELLHYPINQFKNHYKFTNEIKLKIVNNKIEIPTVNALISKNGLHPIFGVAKFLNIKTKVLPR